MKITSDCNARLDMAPKKFRYCFDFDNTGIDMYVDGDWVAEPGADNGLGVAAIMAVLESKDTAHPIEALFTIDEETGIMEL
jgi:dipeptidase D